MYTHEPCESRSYLFAVTCIDKVVEAARTPCGLRPAHRRDQRPAVEIRDAVPTLSNGHPIVFLTALGKTVNDMAKSGLLAHRHVGRSPV